jgi:hypothetical protein
MKEDLLEPLLTKPESALMYLELFCLIFMLLLLLLSIKKIIYKNFVNKLILLKFLFIFLI